MSGLRSRRPVRAGRSGDAAVEQHPSFGDGPAHPITMILTRITVAEITSRPEIGSGS